MSSSTLPKANFEPWRAIVIYAILALVSMTIVGRLFQYQIVEYSAWKGQADENRTREISVQTQRGIIYDRNNFILARNIASYNVVITPAALPDDQADIQRIYRELSALIDVPVNFGDVEYAKNFSACVPGPGLAQLVELGDSLAPYSPVRIKCNVTDNVARIVREHEMDWPGVSIQIEPVRDYPTGVLTSNMIGFLGPIPANLQDYYEGLGFVANRDKVGYSGVEAFFDEVLAGRNGKRVVEVDVAGQELRNLQPPQDPIPGNNLVLTIDTRLQKAVDTALTTEINYWNTLYQRVFISSGAIIAINPKTGEILAMASYPSYENNRLARIIPAYYYNQLVEDPRKPMLNHAVSDEYPPGSVFKLSTAVGSLNEGVINLGQIVQTPGILTLTESFSPNNPGREQQYVDWIYKGGLNPGGFGQLDFLHCIAYSSNVCFYKLGGGYKTEIPEGLGILRLGEYARALGYGSQTGIELLGEADGLIPTPRWKRINRGENWSTGDTYIASVGQGYVLVTPLQVLLSAATIANDGKLMNPTIIREITDSTGQVVTMYLNEDGTLTSTPASAKSRRISPFTPTQRWDVTKDKLITNYDCEGGYCEDTGEKKVIQDWVIKSVQEGMRLAITDDLGTLNSIFSGKTEQFTTPFPIAVAGKTGTAEYCDNIAQAQNRCQSGNWPAHSWTVAFAPYDDPEIAVVAFAYNGTEGSTVAGPMVRLVMEAYFCLKSLDANPGSIAGCE
jgi:penicillin-binding protein 2